MKEIFVTDFSKPLVFDSHGEWLSRYTRRLNVRGAIIIALAAPFIVMFLINIVGPMTEEIIVSSANPETWSAKTNANLVLVAVTLGGIIWYTYILGQTFGHMRHDPLVSPSAREGVSKGPATFRLMQTGLQREWPSWVCWTDWRVFDKPYRVGGVVTLLMRHHGDIQLPAAECGEDPSLISREIGAARNRSMEEDPTFAPHVGPPPDDWAETFEQTMTELEVRNSRTLYFSVPKQSFWTIFFSVLFVCTWLVTTIYYSIVQVQDIMEGGRQIGTLLISLAAAVGAVMTAYDIRMEPIALFQRRFRWPKTHQGVDFGECSITLDAQWLMGRRRHASYAIRFEAIDRVLLRDGFVFIEAGGLLIDSLFSQPDFVSALETRLSSAGLSRKGGPWASNEGDIEWSNQ